MSVCMGVCVSTQVLCGHVQPRPANARRVAVSIQVAGGPLRTHNTGGAGIARDARAALALEVTRKTGTTSRGRGQLIDARPGEMSFFDYS